MKGVSGKMSAVKEVNTILNAVKKKCNLKLASGLKEKEANNDLIIDLLINTLIKVCYWKAVK